MKPKPFKLWVAVTKRGRLIRFDGGEILCCTTRREKPEIEDRLDLDAGERLVRFVCKPDRRKRFSTLMEG